MDLETFVETTLVQIAGGLRKANLQIKESWAAEGRQLIDRQYFILPPNTTAADRTVEFDVAITASAKGGVDASAKGKLFVADATVSGKGELARERVSRVHFRIQVEQAIF